MPCNRRKPKIEFWTTLQLLLNASLVDPVHAAQAPHLILFNRELVWGRGYIMDECMSRLCVHVRKHADLSPL